VLRFNLECRLEGLTGKISKTTKDFLQAVYNENARLIRLTKNLLNISKIKSKRINYDIEKFNPQNLVKEVIQLMQPLAEEKNLVLQTKIQTAKLRVKADRDMLKEILMNLIDNSIRYTSKGSITVGYKSDIKMVKFFVTDTGEGISPNQQKQLFTDLDLLNEKNILTKKGRGLGLYITQNLLNGMKGKISVESQLKKGTTFYFWLPKV
jgi:two-component system, OmpR family, phosphate regulon sensor histidine kinase PhoR